MGKRKEADLAVHVSDLVMDRHGHARWAVMATFVDVDGSEPRCIEYRVRVVPTMPNRMGSIWVGHQVIGIMEKQAVGERSEHYLAAELSVPPEGIPRRVFEEASQSRLLAKARRSSKRRPERLDPKAVELLQRQARPRRVGRPPARSLGEKLRILADVEAAYRPGSGETLEMVAERHFMERTSLRNLISWARSDAQPVLFTNYGPGKRGGELTPAARAMLKEVSD